MSKDKIIKVPEIRFSGFSDEWEEKVLSDFMDFSNGINAPKEKYGKGRKMISVLDILDRKTLTYDNIKNSVEVDSVTENKNKVENGDLIFVRSSEIIEEVGLSKAYLQDEYALYSGFSIRGKKKTQFNSFCMELILNNSCRQQIERKAGGSTRFNISQSILNHIIVVIPTLPEQTKIGELFKAIDEFISILEKELENLKETKKGFLQKMFPKNDETVPEIRFAGFSDEWEEKKLGDVGDIITGNTPSTKYTDNYSTEGIPWVTPSDISYLKTYNTSKNLSKKGEVQARIVPKYSVLVTCIASIGKNTMVMQNSAFNQQINAIVPYENYNPYFILTIMTFVSKKMLNIAGVGTMSIVNKTLFSSININIPTLPEQTKIGNFFKSIDELIEKKENEILKIKDTKKALLQKMFI